MTPASRILTTRLSRAAICASVTVVFLALAAFTTAPQSLAAEPGVQPASAILPDAPAAESSPDTKPAAPLESTSPSSPAASNAQPSTQAAAEPARDSPSESSLELPAGLGSIADWTSPEGITPALQMVALMTVISLAPAVLMMTTCFVRIVVVLGLLRQALGTQQLPPSQVMTSIALFMTLLVMSPVWTKVYHEAVVPYTQREITLEQACDAGIKPVRQFMSAQIERTGNNRDVWLFYKYLPAGTSAPASYDDVPLTVLLPAFMLSELKTSFLIGFQIYLPFLVLDLVVASVTISMGMLMLPPVMISLPFKLLLFVLVDGWHLVVGMLLDSFQTFT